MGTEIEQKRGTRFAQKGGTNFAQTAGTSLAQGRAKTKWDTPATPPMKEMSAREQRRIG